MKKRKVPLRKCIACGEAKAKKGLIRIVKTNEDEIKVDLTGKINGRGAYICPTSQCLEEAIETKKISRSLKVEVTDSVYEELKKVVEGLKQEENTLK